MYLYIVLYTIFFLHYGNENEIYLHYITIYVLLQYVYSGTNITPKNKTNLILWVLFFGVIFVPLYTYCSSTSSMVF